jgi:hypothetical protein
MYDVCFRSITMSEEPEVRKELGGASMISAAVWSVSATSAAFACSVG